eukprot:7998143-Pyramimonas_sp.AAC.1
MHTLALPLSSVTVSRALRDVMGLASQHYFILRAIPLTLPARCDLSSRGAPVKMPRTPRCTHACCARAPTPPATV